MLRIFNVKNIFIYCIIYIICIISLCNSKKTVRLSTCLGETNRHSFIPSTCQTQEEIRNIPDIITDSSITTISNTKPTLEIFSKLDPKTNQQVLTYFGLMLAGAIARTVSAVAVHPLNVMKTMLQTKHGKMPEMKWSVLSRGAGSQIIMSIPHGALNFVATEV